MSKENKPFTFTQGEPFAVNAPYPTAPYLNEAYYYPTEFETGEYMDSAHSSQFFPFSPFFGFPFFRPFPFFGFPFFRPFPFFGFPFRPFF